MPIIKTSVFIDAPAKLCFDMARNIDIHMLSTSQTNEKAIAGKTSGYIELNDTVTWKATHFGIPQKLTVKITEFESPDYFVDEMVSGVLGKIADHLFLKEYMSRFLQKRNEFIKKLAEEML